MFPLYTKTEDPDSIQKFVRHISPMSCVVVNVDMNRVESHTYVTCDTGEYEYFTRGDSVECDETEYRIAFETVVGKLRSL